MENKTYYDYIIVGAGSAGCVLANRLSADASVKVLLLEAGLPDQQMEIHIPLAFAKLFKTAYDWAYYTTPQTKLNNRKLFWPRGKVLGGSSSINAMIYIRGHHQDYDYWQALGNEDWGFDKVLHYFRKSENQERGESFYHGVGGPLNVADLRSINPLSRAFVSAAEELGFALNQDFNGAEQDGFGFYQVTQKDGKRCSAAAGYISPILSRPNLTVKTQTHVTKLLIEANKVIGIAYLSDGKEEKVYINREVILSAGAINSPQILMLSGIGQADELKSLDIDVVCDLPGVGKNLQDHLFLSVAYACKEPVSLASAETPENIAEFIQHGQGPLTSNVGEAGGFIRTNSNVTQPDIQFHFGPVYYLNHGFVKPEGHGLSIGPTLICPESVGYIKLESKDPLSAPIIEPCYLTSQKDMDSLVAAVKVVKEMVTTKAFQPYCGEPVCSKLATDQEIEDFVRETVETLYHPIGTCKMGSDKLAVVDSKLKVHGINNLRIVDASVMPRIVAGNTNAPVIMIAEKAADLITQS
jgi:choline dehydrogenase